MLLHLYKLWKRIGDSDKAVESYKKIVKFKESAKVYNQVLGENQDLD